jgi:hypothetical protein
MRPTSWDFHEIDRVRGVQGNAPLDIVVKEGRASYFAVSLYPEPRPRHTSRLSDVELREQVIRDRKALLGRMVHPRR